MMRDNMKLYKKFSNFFGNCHLCSKPDHFFTDCSILHFVPDRNFIISKLNFSQPQIRSEKKYLRNPKKFKVLNSLTEIQDSAFEFQKNIDEEKASDCSEQESRDMLLIHSQNFEICDHDELKSQSPREVQINSFQDTDQPCFSVIFEFFGYR